MDNCIKGQEKSILKFTDQTLVDLLLIFKPSVLCTGLAQCILFDKKNNMFGDSIYIKKT